MSEQNIDAETVRAEHLSEVREWAHWAYLLGVLGGSFVLMLLFVAILGATAE